MKEWWDNMEKWQRRLSAVVVLLVTIGVVGKGVWAGYEAVHWQGEADMLEQQLASNHNKDFTAVLQMLAEEKRADRVQRNAREYARVVQSFKDESWETEGGKIMMEKRIEGLSIAICKDANEFEKENDPVIKEIACAY